MSTTNHGNGGMNNSQDSGNAGFEGTDFNWSLVLLSLPIFVCILVGFTLVCVFWFRGFKESEITVKAAYFETEDLNILRAKENETLSQYKLLDPQKGIAQIPIEKAMELVVDDHKNSPGADWKPITDTYVQGSAFASSTVKEFTNSGESQKSKPAEQDKSTKKNGKQAR